LAGVQPPNHGTWFGWRLLDRGCRRAKSAGKCVQRATAKCDNQIRSTYLLGPDDQLDISAPELTDVNNKPVRIDGQGDIAVPLAGSVHVAG